MNYDDIINLPHPTSAKHPRMSMLNRAAQFAPFAALTGHDKAIEESARLTDNAIELDDDLFGELNRKMSYLHCKQKEEPIIHITYFMPDNKKSGGQYNTFTGTLKRIDDDHQELLFLDKTRIPIHSIIEMNGDLFESMDQN